MRRLSSSSARQTSSSTRSTTRAAPPCSPATVRRRTPVRRTLRGRIRRHARRRSARGRAPLRPSKTRSMVSNRTCCPMPWTAMTAVSGFGSGRTRPLHARTRLHLPGAGADIRPRRSLKKPFPRAAGRGRVRRRGRATWSRSGGSIGAEGDGGAAGREESDGGTPPGTRSGTRPFRNASLTLSALRSDGSPASTSKRRVPERRPGGGMSAGNAPARVRRSSRAPAQAAPLLRRAAAHRPWCGCGGGPRSCRPARRRR